VSVAIGVFDGIHLGHQALIKAAVADARAHNRESLVFTFDRHPAEVTEPTRVPGYITTPEQRLAIFNELEIDHLVIAHFDEQFRELSPESFLHFVMSGVLGARAVFVGQDFRFGRFHSGNVEYLREAATRYGYTLNVLDPVMVDGVKASSSHVRELIRAGQVKDATDALGRPFTLVGTVVEGKKLGRTLGFPTANLQPIIRQVLPADGIYATCVMVDGVWHLGALSVGLRPTVNGKHRTVEVYILDFDADIYGHALDVEFISRLREERKFESLDLLVEQMHLDVAEVRARFSEG